MTAGTRHYLAELSAELAFHPDSDEIIAEYEGHVEEVAQEFEVALTYETLVDRLGDPRTIAGMWKAESTVTEPRLQWLFVCCNIILFVGGSLLTVGYHLFRWSWLQWTWHTLTSIPMVIVFTYFAFWGLLGYEIGKTFGSNGRPLLGKTFLIGMVPNFILMALTIFHIIPHQWFDPLITQEFIWICVLGTALLYPFTWMGFRWGKRMSV